ncbi:MAG: IclR family transcriptional regulator [Terriglobia bacterium]
MIAASKGYSVPSIDRALTVLEFLGESKRGFSLSEISRRLGLPKSSAHLVLTTLEHRGFLQKNTHTGRYSFGLRLISLSRSALENLDLREEARPFLQSLMQKTGLTVHMAVLERQEVVIIEKVEAPGLVRVATWIGRRLDVNCTGVGKAIVAFLPADELEKLVRSKSFAKHNEYTLTSASTLKRDLTQVRELGYALDDEEDEIGLRCIGAPVFDDSQKVVAAISVAGTVSQIPIDRVRSLASMVKEAAACISSRLGYVVPGSESTPPPI